MTQMTSKDIRARFIRFFEERGHAALPSGSLIPRDDPTLLFTNAGMVQFKQVFLGEQARPAARAVTVQKCLRVSGKHNDLEEVGRTARHHTFFEMLGNFSFGDYFKREAIAYAWEFVIGDLGLDPERLWATVHESDDEAHGLWLQETDLPAERILRLGDAENFWQMGETGPCGPCSELHYDLRSESERRGGRSAGSSHAESGRAASGDRDATPLLTPDEFLRLGEADRFTEIWNLVFMQFDRGEDGVDRPLPAPSIDTGAGLERLAAVVQGVPTNYQTDLFVPLLEEVGQIVGREYPGADQWEEGLPYRVLADHARAVAFMLADGVFPSNEGRGYVLRRILRRAGRFAWLLGRREPTLDRLVAVVADQMAGAYPELASRREHLLQTTRAEEERFLATIDAGMHRFEEVVPAGTSGTLAGEEAFRLYDTYGFPVDLTELMAAERGWDVDHEGFEAALERQRERSRRARDVAAGGQARAAGELRLEQIRGPAADDGEQEFVGYEELLVETPVLRFGADGERRAFVLLRNPFYVEAGGQVSDRGRITGDGWEVRVDTVERDREGDVVAGGELVAGTLDEAPESVRAEVLESARRDTQCNHTATHLLHAALRAELGDHVHQAGSLVAPDRLRFDFTHHGPLTAEQRRNIERRVNEAVLANLPVSIGQRPYREALDEGAMALFGEQYGDVVRVVGVPGVSLELCGGCHVRTTGEIGLFLFTSETGVAAGVRRVEAVTGHEAHRRAVESRETLAGLGELLRAPAAELRRRAEALLDERERLQRMLEDRRGEDASDTARRLVARSEELPGGGALASGSVELPAGSDLPAFGDLLREAVGSGAAIAHVTLPGDGKEAFIAVVTDDWIARGVRAGDLARTASEATGARGGGRPHLAQGGVGDSAKAAEALEAAASRVREAAEGVRA